MDSSIYYYLIPTKDFKTLQVEFDESLYNEGINSNDVCRPRKYKFRNLDTCGFLPEGCKLPTDERELSGIMSPSSVVTVPPYAKKMIGISQDAEYFAYLHPPTFLADYLAKIGFLKGLLDTEDVRVQIANFAMFGAFVYFDDEMESVGISILSTLKTNFKLPLRGPFPTSEIAMKEVQDRGRFHTESLESHHEMGVHEIAWITPGEKFQSDSATNFGDCTDGAFICRNFNGTSVTYVVSTGINENDLTVDFLQSTQMMDIRGNEEHFGFEFFEKFKPVSIHMTCMDRQQLKQRVASLLAGRKSTSGAMLRNVLNEAIKSKFPLKDLERLINMNGEGNLDQSDYFGWTSLHYACSFMPDSDNLIQLLLENSPEAAKISDRFHKFPLHLACEGAASRQTIKILLEANKNATITPTLHMRRLPLHLACQRGLSKDIICDLLDADEDGSSVRWKTRSERIALHFAIESKSEDVIEALLQADTKMNNLDLEFNSDDDDIYQVCHGILPLHYACCAGVSSKVIRLLLEKDGKNTTLMQKVETQFETKDGITYQSNKSPTRRSLERYVTRKSLRASESLHNARGMRALHLALVKKCPETVRLILRHEHKAFETTEHRLKMAKMCDTNGRTGLHLACMNNFECGIIKALLDMDPSRESLLLKDIRGCTPLHYACMHASARPETMQVLLGAEEEFFGLKSISSLNHRKRNPLNIAVTEDANADALEVLLQPKNFDLTGFGPGAKLKLAMRIRNDTKLQQTLNLTLCQRASFAWLFSHLITNLSAFFLFSVVVDPGAGDSIMVKERLESYVLLLFCNMFFWIKELMQMKAQKADYFVEISNSLDIMNNLFLSLSLYHVASDDDQTEKWPDDKRYIYIISGILLGVHTLFSLRSTFLPFARFVRGTQFIMVTLIPFFVTTGIVLYIFTQIFRAFYQGTPEEDKQGCLSQSRFLKEGGGDGMDSLLCLCSKDWGGCFYGVIHGFFSGPGETENVLHIANGFLIVVVLLNVVIAIVSDAWEHAKEDATRTYWHGRVLFLSEAAFTTYQAPVKFHTTEKIFKWIDSIPCFLHAEAVSWDSDVPYNQVKFRKQYEDPFYYFVPDVAEKIKRAHSLRSDLYWIQNRKLKGDARFNAQLEVMRSYLRWTFHLFVYFLLLFLGLPTLGILWPRTFRIWLLSIGNSGDSSDENKAEDAKDR